MGTRLKTPPATIRTIDKAGNIRQRLADENTSALETYRALTCGKTAFSRFVTYELLTALLGPLPGGAGFLLRKLFYPRLFGAFGRGVIIGRNVTFRHTARIRIGDHVTIDDNCVIDGRGAGPAGLVLEDRVLVNRNCMLLAKNGPIRLGRRTSLGSNSVVVSMDGIETGEAVLTAGGCYLSAGAYRVDGAGAVMDQEAYTNGPIRIGSGAWLGTRVTVLDGVRIGQGAVVGACAMVNSDIPDRAIAVGIPAKVVRMRDAAGRST